MKQNIKMIMNEGYKKFSSIYLSVTVLINVLSPKC